MACSWTILVLALAGGSAALDVRQPPVVQEPVREELSDADRMTRVLREALSPGDVSGRDRLLRGLRRLHDPSMAPLFARLAVAQDARLRSHGILGTGEFDREQGLDLLALSKLEDKRELAGVIVEALEENLLSSDQVQEVMRWKSVPEEALLALAAKAGAQGKPVPRSVGERLLSSVKPESRLRGAIAGLQMGQSESTMKVLRESAQALVSDKGDVDASRQQLIAIMGQSRRESLWAGARELARIVQASERSQSDPLLSFEALATTLASEPGDEYGVMRTLAKLDSSNDLGERLRAGLAVMEATLAREQADERLIAAMLKDQSELIREMGASVQAVVIGCGSAPDALVRLASLGHAPSSELALRMARKRSYQDATAIRVAIINACKPEAGLEMSALVQRAAQELCDDDPGQLGPLLEGALSENNAARARAMLAGVLQSTHREAWKLAQQGTLAAKPSGAWPDEVCVALATLVLTRGPESPPEHVAKQRTETLTAVAQGRWNMNPTLRFAAAWQALRLMGQDKAALARVMSN